MTQLETSARAARQEPAATETVVARDPRSSPAPRGPWAVALAAVWFGFVAGLLELLVLLVNRAVVHRIVLDWLRMSRHAYWMAPVANLALFTAVGAVFAGVACGGGRRVFPAALAVLGTMTALAPLLALHRLHPVACLLLAAGVGARFAMITEARTRRLQRVIRLSLPGLAALTLAWGVYDYVRVAGAEARTLGALPLAPPDAPNVLLIVLDTVRADHLGTYGYARSTTPRLDALARRGVQFDRALSTAPWTLPAHASLFTGRWHSELTANADRELDSSFPVLAEYLRDHGYATAGFVANTTNCNSCYGFDRGFSRYEDRGEKMIVSPVEILNCSELVRDCFELTGLRDQLGLEADGHRKDAPTINRDVLAWLEHQGGRPFFAFLNYYDAHAPFILPDGVPSRFGPARRTPAQEKLLRDWSYPERGVIPPHDASLSCDAYDDGIAYLDSQVGCLFDEMEQLGLLENTIVIVTADHGESLGEHDLYSHGRSLYQSEIHVPLLISAPRSVPMNRHVAGTVSLRDVPGTVADLAGLGASSPFPGQSLARYWRGDGETAPSGDAPIFSEVFIRTTPGGSPKLAPALRVPMRAVVVGDSKYVWYGDGTEELYNLADDPHESNNLASTSELRNYRELLGIAGPPAGSRPSTVARKAPVPEPDGSGGAAQSGGL